MPWISERAAEITWDRLQTLMSETVAEAQERLCAKPKRVLLLPPDITRMHSGAGRLTEMLYHLLKDEADVQVIPTLGQHVPHTAEENRLMFGSIPNERIHAHDWRGGCVEVAAGPHRGLALGASRAYRRFFRGSEEDIRSSKIETHHPAEALHAK